MRVAVAVGSTLMEQDIENFSVFSVSVEMDIILSNLGGTAFYLALLL